MENNIITYDFNKFAQEVELLTKICKQLMGTKHYMALGEAGIFAILQRAKALNIDPFDALNGGLYYINGKVGMSTELMASLIRRQGHKVIKDPSSNDIICKLHGKRADSGDEWTSTFSMEDAERASLTKPNKNGGPSMFVKYPAIMLYNRAMSALARQLFPDVIKGAGYEKDELEEIEVNKPIHCHSQEIQIAPSAPLKTELTNIITEEMEEELKELLLKDLDYKKKVDDFLGAKNFTSFSQLTYADFTGLVRNAKKRREKEQANDTATAA